MLDIPCSVSLFGKENEVARPQIKNTSEATSEQKEGMWAMRIGDKIVGKRGLRSN
jgi:hypothetical protein